MRFTLTYTEGNEIDRPETPEDFETIQEAKAWCDRNNVDYYVMNITEWHYSRGLGFDSCAEIVAQCNFDIVAEENWQDLSKAIN